MEQPNLYREFLDGEVSLPIMAGQRYEVEHLNRICRGTFTGIVANSNLTLRHGGFYFMLTDDEGRNVAVWSRDIVAIRPSE
jgi:hypothetical protein